MADTLQKILDAAKEHGPMSREFGEDLRSVITAAAAKLGEDPKDYSARAGVLASVMAEAAGRINRLERELARSSLVTVCMHCKAVTSDHRVSHGLCDGCMERHYPVEVAG